MTPPRPRRLMEGVKGKRVPDGTDEVLEAGAVAGPGAPGDPPPGYATRCLGGSNLGLRRVERSTRPIGRPVPGSAGAAPERLPTRVGAIWPRSNPRHSGQHSARGGACRGTADPLGRRQRGEIVPSTRSGPTALDATVRRFPRPDPSESAARPLSFCQDRRRIGEYLRSGLCCLGRSKPGLLEQVPASGLRLRSQGYSDEETSRSVSSRWLPPPSSFRSPWSVCEEKGPAEKMGQGVDNAGKDLKNAVDPRGPMEKAGDKG